MILLYLPLLPKAADAESGAGSPSQSVTVHGCDLDRGCNFNEHRVQMVILLDSTYINLEKQHTGLTAIKVESSDEAITEE